MGAITGIYQCPACQGALHFRSAETNLLVCPACKSAINRLDGDILVVKSVYITPSGKDMIRPGVQGRLEKQPFEVLGITRFWLDEYVINYWTILLADGSCAYLAESYGMYSIMRARLLDREISFSDIKNLHAGSPFKLLQKGNFFLQAKYHCIKYETEGEVWKFTDSTHPGFYEFASPDGTIITVLSLAGYLSAFDVEYVSFAELQLTGIGTEILQSREIACPACKKGIVVKTYPYAQSCTCSCGERIGLQNGVNFTSAGRDSKGANNNAADIPLGVTGTIFDTTYEVIGYALKQDTSKYKSRWKEYVLYNYQEGYAFLNEYEGHWIFSREKGTGPVVTMEGMKQLSYRGNTFDLFNRYRFTLIDTEGEFPGNIFKGKSPETSEFIAPPEMWVIEKTPNEMVTSLGQHIEKQELEKAFGVTLPFRKGIGAIQPQGYLNPQKLVLVSIIAVLALLLAHFSVSSAQAEKEILRTEHFFYDSATVATIVSDRFTLTKWKSNLEFQILSPVYNSWLELEMVLVNAVTGTEYAIEQGVEYYHGYEDGEGWSEGSTSETAYLSSIPAGTYFLRLQATRDYNNRVSDFNLVVKNDVPVHRNFYLFLVMLLIWPVGKYYWVRYIERERWYNSPYSPYTYNDDE
jgi:DNA-directed RNA polymerase subunit RPC12/RpoP